MCDHAKTPKVTEEGTLTPSQQFRNQHHHHRLQVGAAVAPTFQLSNWGFMTCGGHLVDSRGGLQDGQVRANPQKAGWGEEGRQSTPES